MRAQIPLRSNYVLLLHVFQNRDAVEPHRVLQCNANVCPCRHLAPKYLIVGANIDTLCPELCSCLLDLCHQLRMRLGYVVEGEDSPAELEEEVCAE
jgi:hypothetical protein